MGNLPIYEMLAQAFAGEGVDAVFNLMGDGNMHWATAISKIDGIRSFHARHEHCACGMAMGYYSATGKTGVASVTCGPGVTQISGIRARVAVESAVVGAPRRPGMTGERFSVPARASRQGTAGIARHSRSCGRVRAGGW